MIIDLDVHQGNGTAEIFKQTGCFYSSSWEKIIHLEKKSDYDYGFKDYTTDCEYLNIVKYIKKLVDNFMPDFIFTSGVDIIENDKLGRLSVSIEGCMER